MPTMTHLLRDLGRHDRLTAGRSVSLVIRGLKCRRRSVGRCALFTHLRWSIFEIWAGHFLNMIMGQQLSYS